MRDTRKFARGTYLVQDYPWGWYIAGRALCSDGKVRNLKRISITSDTFFSVPAAVTVDGKTVAGYITIETLDGFTTLDTDADPATVKFIAYSYGKNGHLLPGTAWRREGAVAGVRMSWE